jgi:hypothetical protein
VQYAGKGKPDWPHAFHAASGLVAGYPDGNSDNITSIRLMQLHSEGNRLTPLLKQRLPSAMYHPELRFTRDGQQLWVVGSVKSNAFQFVYTIVYENGVPTLKHVESRPLGKDVDWIGCFKTRPAVAAIMHKRANVSLWSLRDGSRIATLKNSRFKVVDFECVFPLHSDSTQDADYPLRAVIGCKDAIHVWTFLGPPIDPIKPLQPHASFYIEPMCNGPFTIDFGCLFTREDQEDVTINSLEDGEPLAKLDADEIGLEMITRVGDHMWAIGMYGVKRLLM